MRGWRGLGRFWLGVIVLALAGGAALQWAAPPPSARVTAAAKATPAEARPAESTPSESTPAKAPPINTATSASAGTSTPSPAARRPAAAEPARVAQAIAEAPPPAAQAAADAPARPVAPTGAPPSGAPPAEALPAAAPPRPSPGRPRIALLLTGIGLDQQTSLRAIALPAGISLAVSPYAADPAAAAAAVRAAGHELLIELPLEPANFPLDDAGPHALLTGADPTENEHNLAWVLARFGGYTGATGALDGLRGERFAAAAPLFAGLLARLRAQNLFYIDPRPMIPHPDTAALPDGARAVDLVLDDPPGRGPINDRLAELEARARDRGGALGLAGPPTPLLLDRLEAWLAGLDARGLVLVPAGSLVPPP